MSGQLKRQLGFWDSVAINIGVVIGVGIFRVPAEVAKVLGTPEMILLAWVLGGVVSLFGVLCYAELSSCLPQTGGTYVYLREAFGKITGFLFGWMEILVFRAGSLAGVAFVFAAYFKNVLPAGLGSEKALAISAIFFFTALNIAGMQFGKAIQNVLSTMKGLTLLAMTAIIFFWVQSWPAPGAERGLELSGKGMFLLASAMIPVLWGYGGWHESTFMSGEFKDTKRALPLSLIASILIITALYVAINSAYLAVMTPARMAETPSIASSIFQSFFGSSGGLIMTAAVIVSACGALNSYILTGARIPFAVAQDTARISFFGNVHGKLQTPVTAFVFNGLWASVLVLWGNFESLLFFTGFSKWLFFSLAGLSVFVLRKRRPAGSESFRITGYPVIPLFFTLFAVTLLVIDITVAPREALFGALLLGAGIPVYFVLQGQGASSRKTPGAG